MRNVGRSYIILLQLLFLLFGCGRQSFLSINFKNGGEDILNLSPILVQLGGTTVTPGNDHSEYDYCQGVSVDSLGNVYCAGYTRGSLGEGNAGSYDAFIMKLDSSGNLEWVTQLGDTTVTLGNDHSEYDYCQGVSVDSLGNVYCAGSTRGALGEGNAGSYDAFVMKLDSDGNIEWITQLGDTTVTPGNDHSDSDSCDGVSVDSLGNVYCAGHTYGSLGEGNSGTADAFIMKLDSDGNIEWITQLGDTTVTLGNDHSEYDLCNGVSVDSLGNVYCAGYTKGSLGEGNAGNFDAFVMKLDSDGNLEWITQLGDTTVTLGGVHFLYDSCNGVSVDSLGNVYCAGYTQGSLGEGNAGNFDAFVMKLDSDGSIEWITQLGGTTVTPGGDHSRYDSCNGVSVDSLGNVYCAGNTQGSLGEGNAGGYDAFIMKLDSDGNIEWITQLGGTTVTPGGDHSVYDYCNGVSVDGLGNVYCAGNTQGSLGEENAGYYDIFITRLTPDGLFY
jgi:uncharacterized delta-60 repeat protein